MKLDSMTDIDATTQKWTIKRLAQELCDYIGPVVKTPRASRVRAHDDKGEPTPTKKGARATTRGGATTTRSASIMAAAEDEDLIFDDDAHLYDDDENEGLIADHEEQVHEASDHPEPANPPTQPQAQPKPQPKPQAQSQAKPKAQQQQQQEAQRKTRQQKQKRPSVNSVDLTDDGNESPGGTRTSLFTRTNRSLFLGSNPVQTSVQTSEWLQEQFAQIHQSNELVNKDLEIIATAVVDIKDLLKELVNALVPTRLNAESETLTYGQQAGEGENRRQGH
ncbi:hypothetical protein AAP_02876 [Ascosphaera apis ARSEF 7405]|uniref:Uncharacterized protein n=1 Tax=Ascosphaera apis ARSEF 7405 TaxID=392613 RepID=A0A167Z633_9EURO|nr:hypothetical protein AAP_02876 [Ascosphaera apis ARSEF 7405]